MTTTAKKSDYDYDDDNIEDKENSVTARKSFMTFLEMEFRGTKFPYHIYHHGQFDLNVKICHKGRQRTQQSSL